MKIGHLDIPDDAQEAIVLKSLRLLESLKEFERASGMDKLAPFDKFLFGGLLRYKETRTLDNPVTKELITLRTRIAIEMGDLKFFVRLGRALEQPAKEADKVEFDKLGSLLVVGWRNGPEKIGTPRFCDMTDKVIADLANHFFSRNCYEEKAVRKTRQRLKLKRKDRAKYTSMKRIGDDLHFF